MTDKDPLELVRNQFESSANHDCTVMEAAVFLGHESTMRVSDLLRDGIVLPGSHPRTILRASVVEYASHRKVKGDRRWYKMLLNPDDVEVLQAHILAKLGYDCTPVQAYKYNAKVRKASVLRGAGWVAPFEELDPDLPKREKQLNEADDHEDTSF